jgi:hypothetical protein
MSRALLLRWPVGDARFCRLIAVAVLGPLSAAAAVVMARGMAGALQTPLQPTTLVTVGVLTAAAGVIVRLAWLVPLGANRIRRLDITVMAITAFAVASLCSGVCSPRSTPPEFSLLVRVVIVVEEGWAWLWFFGNWRRNGSSRAKGPSLSPVCETKTPDPFVPAKVTQQLTRSETADGAEEFSGWLRLPFAPGQRTGSVHVAFCPPLRVTPEVEVEQIEGPEARIKAAQLLPYGARFDLKLVAAAEDPITVLLQFTARTPREE